MSSKSSIFSSFSFTEFSYATTDTKSSFILSSFLLTTANAANNDALLITINTDSIFINDFFEIIKIDINDTETAAAHNNLLINVNLFTSDFVLLAEDTLLVIRLSNDLSSVSYSLSISSISYLLFFKYIFCSLLRLYFSKSLFIDNIEFFISSIVAILFLSSSFSILTLIIFCSISSGKSLKTARLSITLSFSCISKISFCLMLSFSSSIFFISCILSSSSLISSIFDKVISPSEYKSSLSTFSFSFFSCSLFFK